MGSKKILEDKEEIDPITAIFGVCVFLGIIGIICIINGVKLRNDITFFFMSLMVISDEIRDVIMLAIINDGIRLNSPIFILGIILTAAGVVGACIITIYRFPYIKAYFDEQKKLKILILVNIIFITLLIIGIISTIYTIIKRNQTFALLMLGNFIGMESLTQIILLSNLLQPDVIIFQSGILLIVFGSVGTIFSIIIYKNPDAFTKYKSSEDISPEKRKPALLYKIRPEKRITISKCPACHAPLKRDLLVNVNIVEQF